MIMDEFEFKRLIERYQQGLLSGRKKQLLDDWFNAMGQDNVHNLWTPEDKLSLKKKILQQIEGKERKASGGAEPARRTAPVGNLPLRILPVSRRGSYFRAAYRIAASVLLVTVSYFVWQFPGAKPDSAQVLQATASGNINKVLMSDGSIVWLKGNSILTYAEKFSGSERRVTLQGEALFEVAKDPAHPFIIQCGELTTTVLGTSFNIKSSERNIEVLVLTGKVSLTAAGHKEAVVVLPNEKAVFDRVKKQLARIETAKEEKTATVARTEYSMDFEDTPMSEIIRRIEGKFNVSVTMHEPGLGNCMITADFTDQSLARTLRMISRALGCEYEIDGKEISLRGTGCERK